MADHDRIHEQFVSEMREVLARHGCEDLLDELTGVSPISTRLAGRLLEAAEAAGAGPQAKAAVLRQRPHEEDVAAVVRAAGGASSGPPARPGADPTTPAALWAKAFARADRHKESDHD